MARRVSPVSSVCLSALLLPHEGAAPPLISWAAAFLSAVLPSTRRLSSAILCSTDATAEVGALQGKFSAPFPCRPDEARAQLYHGEGPVSGGPTWDTVEPAGAKTPGEWEAYLRQPFKDHAGYIAELKRIVLKYPTQRGRKEHT